MIAKGIKTSFIESNNVFSGDDVSAVSRLKDIPAIKDQVRYRSGNFAYVNKNKINNLSNLLPISLQFLSKERVKITANKNYFIARKLIDGITKEYFDSSLWKAFLLGETYNEVTYANLTKIQNSFGEFFTDHYTSIDVPFEERNQIKNNNNSLNFFNNEFVYNFFSPDYEAAIARLNTTEYTIPSYYSFKKYLKNKDNTSYELAQISLGGAIQTSLYENFFNKSVPPEIKREYFNQYGKKYDTPDAVVALRDNRTISDTILEDSEISDYKDFLNSEFPFYTQLQFLNPGEKEVLSILKNTGLQKKFAEDYLTKNGFGFLNFIFSKENGENYEQAISVYDFTYWYQQNILSLINDQALPEKTFLNSSKLINLSNDLKKLANTNFRTVEEIYKGKKAHSEIFMFKIEKYLNNPKGNPLQTFYFYPTKDSLINFFDTQIKYGRKYAYKISAIVLVFGNQYNFENYYSNLIDDKNFVTDIENGEFILNIKNIPSIKVLEIPYFDFSGACLETPTSIPDINFQSFNRLNDRVKITGGKQNSVTFIKPIIIEATDSQYFNLLVESQKNENLKTYFYKFDKNPKKLQIYRTTKKPNIYSDFSGKLHATINLSTDLFSTIDNIVPNNKYYYLFRFLNDHGNASNPSKIYEVELKSEDEINYLVMEEYTLEKNLYSESSKDFKKYLQVTPVLPQILINNSQQELEKIINSGNISNISLGVNEKAIWDKTFKLRITSKKTSRKIDINFKFIKDSKDLKILDRQNISITTNDTMINNVGRSNIYIGIL